MKFGSPSKNSGRTETEPSTTTSKRERIAERMVPKGGEGVSLPSRSAGPMGRLQRHRRRSRWPGALALVSLIVLLLLGGLVFYRPFQSKAKAGPLSEASAAEAEAGPQTTLPPPAPLPGKRTTFLVMGVDKRPDDSGRADSMVLVSYDGATNQISLLSLPRDTWVEIPGHGYDKINHSYAYGGEPLAVQTVQRFLGIPIDHYVTVTFDGFRQIIDAIGGVDVDAEKRLQYSDPYDTSMGPDGLVIDIEPGPQHMDGLTALKYARFRADAEADFGRMRRQQQVAAAMVKAVARPATIARLPQLIGAVAKSLSTDLSLSEMLKFGLGAKSALSTPLRTGTLGGEPTLLGGVSYLIPDLVAERTKAYQTLVGDTPPDSFLERAREDQAAYSRALAEARAASTVETALSPAPGPGPESEPEPSTSSARSTPPAAKPAQKPQPITIAVIDASGKRLGSTYAAKFKAAGFRVARVSALAKVLAQSVALDHAGQPGTADRIRAVLPGALVISAPDEKADEAVEIILGSDVKDVK